MVRLCWHFLFVAPGVVTSMFVVADNNFGDGGVQTLTPHVAKLSNLKTLCLASAYGRWMFGAFLWVTT